MNCANCGSELGEEEEYCQSCGAPVRASGEPQAPPTRDEPPVAEPLESPLTSGPLPPGQAGEASAGEFVEAPKHRMSLPVMIVTGVLVVGLVAAAVIVPIVINSRNSEKKAQKLICQSYQKTVDAAIMEYAAVSPEENYPSSLEDLVSPGYELLTSIPTCPSGTLQYIWVEGKIGSPPSISCPNHPDHAL